MDYIDSWDKAGIEKGIKIGVKRGLQIGIKIGETRVLLSMLGRFGQVDAELTMRVRELPEAKILELATALFDFKSMADVRKWMSLD